MATMLRVGSASGTAGRGEDVVDRRQVLAALLRERWHALHGPPAARTGGPDPADAAREREEEMVWLAVLDRSRDLQAQVGEALRRLVAGRYGLCAECNELIPLVRLRALPFAVRCLPCQERAERAGAGSAVGPNAGVPRRTPAPSRAGATGRLHAGKEVPGGERARRGPAGPIADERRRPLGLDRLARRRRLAALKASGARLKAR